jgi:hypothetical protein
MSNHEKLTAALLGAFAVAGTDQEAAATALAGVMVAHQEPVLAEMRKQTTLLEVIAKQGEFNLEQPPCGAVACGLPG